ncbi:uncharacterized protein PHACADRAFT_251618 [Phanerochaete carnosa HHB-10118-sp]|uniref:Uncharacterized protein n=1 Tax=Phanerochaete carnosa (strain HHB-10118-sp) TaxID=650164 RepID=K5W1P7_PHACS|nr:uncharacterized protein PHACADRAFT_251618 [Phanerochaete carnosa HHB-10118-sp]EKM57778.1 hypothetical protein PHACADRAFT_251618 [Phanerochaete carnosa HHB-10118-sp]
MAGSSITSGAGRPSPSRRHSRVASLPSMKTPPILGPGTTQEINSFAPTGSFSLSLGPKARERQNQHQTNQVDQQVQDDRMRQHPQMSYSSVRTTLHGDADDLKSYEQAVLARKAPTILNLVPKRRGTMPAGSSAPDVKRQVNMSPPHFAQAAGTVGNLTPIPSSVRQTQHQQTSDPSSKIGDLLNRERPSSLSSSLADVFGSPQQQHQQHHHEQQHDHHYPAQDQYRMHQQAEPSSDSPRESSVGADSDSAASASYRPSFKRLASQTLGPPNAKRALLGPAGWDDVRHGSEESEAIEEDDELDEDDATSKRFSKSGYDGRRRFSMPARTDDAITLPPIRPAAVGHD